MPLEILDHRDRPEGAAAPAADTSTVTLDADLIGTKEDGRTYLVAAAGATIPRALFEAHTGARPFAPGPELTPSESKPAFPATARKARKPNDEDEVTA